MRGAAVKRLARGECQFGSAIVIEQADELASKDGQRFALLEGWTGLCGGAKTLTSSVFIGLFVGGPQTLGGRDGDAELPHAAFGQGPSLAAPVSTAFTR